MAIKPWTDELFSGACWRRARPSRFRCRCCEIMLNGNGTALAQTSDAGLAALRHVVLRQRLASRALEAGEDRGRRGLGAQPPAPAAGGAQVPSHGDQRSREQDRRGRGRAPDRLGRGHDRRGAERERRDAPPPSIRSSRTPSRRVRPSARSRWASRRRRRTAPPDSLHTVSHKGPNARNSRSSIRRRCSPVVHGRRTTTAEAGSRRRSSPNVRKSVLDAVLADGASLQERLGAADKQRVEQHLESIRAIEKRAGDDAARTTQPAGVHQPAGADRGQGREERGAAGGEHRDGRLSRSRSPARGRACSRSCSRCPPRTSTTGTSRRT